MKLQYAPAVELLLVREELQGKLKDYERPDGQITVADILSDDESAIPGLFEDLSLTRLRQVLRSFPNAFSDEWVEKLLGLVPECNLRSISEIANYLDSEGEKDAFVGYMEEGLQQRTLASDALAWICRERKGLSQTVFTPTLSLNVMSSLESDQLNDEGAVRSANRLRDLVADDRDLIPDLIDGANINTIRNFTGRLINSASFDELTRKSLVARVIKLHPDVQDLLAGREEKKDDALIVSEESLVERKAAYDKLIKEEIPQNREDIKVARSYGDLRENFEYKSSKEYQRVLMKRQGDWERDLKLAQPTDFSDTDTSQVSIGTVVKLESTDGGNALTYTVLGAWDSDPDRGIIAYLSERGNELLGKKPGDEIEFHSAEGVAKGIQDLFDRSLQGLKSYSHPKLKRFSLLAALLCAASSSFGAEKKPNIVFINADDLTHTDLSVYGGQAITPNFERLASEGMRFTHCFQAAPMCSPTRHNLYTGIHPVKSGAYPNHTFAKEGTKSIVHHLKPHGYRVALSGKTHIAPKSVFPFEYSGKKIPIWKSSKS